ncbi:hypothetical protein ACFL0C_01775 [Patescibacteria group bacterium]
MRIIKKLFNIKIFLYLLLSIVILFVLAINTRGKLGNPEITRVTNYSLWGEYHGAAYENSSARSRYALIYSLVDDKSFHFSEALARFSTPEVATFDGKYVSLFAPGTSLLAIPGYIIGKSVDMAQVGSYLTISLFAFMNFILIVKISKKLGATSTSSILGALAFLFATPAFGYALSLHQHHITTFMILLSLYALLSFRDFWALVLVWFLCVFSIIVDYPNFFLMFPLGIYALGKIFIIKSGPKLFEFKIRFLYFFSFLIMLLPIGLFLWFNARSYDSPLRLSGTLPRVESFDENYADNTDKAVILEGVADPEKKDSIGFFQTRALLNGFYIHFISPDRGVLFYAPVALLGILGFSYVNRKNQKYFALLLSLLGVNILLYSMWGDPWGGWAFGSRYLIPSYAILSVFIGVALAKAKKYNILILIFSVLTAYSIYINTLGALTTTNMPPKIEVLSLEEQTQRVQHYDYKRNVEFLNNDVVNTVGYRDFAEGKITPWNYFYAVYFSIMSVLAITSVFYLISKRKHKNAN